MSFLLSLTDLSIEPLFLLTVINYWLSVIENLNFVYGAQDISRILDIMWNTFLFMINIYAVILVKSVLFLYKRAKHIVFLSAIDFYLSLMYNENKPRNDIWRRKVKRHLLRSDR